MLKIISVILLTAWTTISIAQSNIEKIVDLKTNNKLELDFKWPELVTVKGWDRNEVKIEGRVSINNGQNDSAFKLKVEESSGSVRISSFIENHDNLPKRIVIRKNGEDHFFNTDDRNAPEVRQFLDDSEHGYDYVSHGVIKDIHLTIYIPMSVSLDAYCEYGLIEIENFEGKLSAASKYGGIDLSVGSIAKSLKAGTRFGHKYSNLSEDFNSISFGDHPGEWDWISYGSRESNPLQEIQSEFGNVYIRKQQ